MKIPSKSVVQNEQAAQTKQQIDMGIKIAQKIDALRQTLGSLEQQQALFISRSQEELRLATKDLYIEIEQKKAEILDLEDRRKVLLEPLDAEWEKVKKVISQIAQDRLSLDAQEAKLVELQRKGEMKFKEAKEVLFKVNVRERTLIKLCDDQEQATADALKIRDEAVVIKNESVEHQKEKKKELLNREALIAVREREQELSESNLIDRTKKLDIREVLLKDREETLDRELQRIKNNKNG